MLLAATIRSGPLMFNVEVEPTAVVVPVGISWTYPDAVVLVAVMLPETALGGIGGELWLCLERHLERGPTGDDTAGHPGVTHPRSAGSG